MPYRTIEIPIALNGLNKDLEATDLSYASPNMKNMIVGRGKIRKWLGYSQLGLNLPLSGIGMELIQYTDARGNIHHIALTTTNAYEYQTGSRMWLLVTPSIDIDECEAGWLKGQGADTVAHDTTYYIRGSKSTKITLGAERVDGNLLAYKDISSLDIRTYADASSALSHIGFWLRSSVAVASGALEIVVSEGKGAAKIKLAFTSGGTHEAVVGDTLVGTDSGATTTIVGITLDSGSWAGGDAEGTFYLAEQTGTYQAEEVEDGDANNLATVASDSSATTSVDSTNSSAIVANTWTFFQIAETLTNFNAVLSVGVYANGTLADGSIFYIDDARAYAPFDGGAGDRWSHCLATDTTVFSNNGGTALVISNGVDSLHYFEGDDFSFQELDMSDFPSFAHTKEIEEFWNHLFCINYNDGDQNIRAVAYADLGDVVDWTRGTSGLSVLTDSRGELMRAKKLGLHMIMYSRKSIATCTYFGSPLIFAFPTIVYETGLFAPKAVWDFVNVHFFVGTDKKIYAYAGGQQLTPIGDPIEAAMFDELVVDKKDSFVVGINTTTHRVYFLYAGPGDSYARRGYAVDYKRRPMTWEYYEFAHSVRDISIFDSEANWYADGAEVAGKYADDAEFVGVYADDTTTQGGHSMTIFLSADGYIFQIDDVSGKQDDWVIDGIYDTMDITVDKEEHYERIAWVSFNAMSTIPNAVVGLRYSTDGGDTWARFKATISIADGEANVWKQHRIPIDIDTRKCRFRLVQKSDKDFQIRKMHCKLLVEEDKE